MRARISTRTRRIAVALLIAVPVFALAGALSLSAGGAVGRTVSSERFDYSLRLPEDWHRSPRRLVPLLMPREVLSVGTFAMRPGGGGNCGREPVASLRRMRRGDALITIQEYEVTAALRAHLTRSFPPLPPGAGLADLAHSPGAGGRPPTFYATVPFSENGRVFDALIYFRGRPGPTLRRAAVSILDGLRFSSDPDRFRLGSSA